VQLDINSNENENQNENEVPAEKQKTNTDANDPTDKFADLCYVSSGVSMLKDSEKRFLEGLIADAISERSSLFDSRGLGKIKIASTIYQFFLDY
jgi:hypothetical protein